MFGVPGSSAATCFARSAVEVKVRMAARKHVAERTAAPNGRPTASREAIV
jgi:hypothetical protein